MNRFAFQLTGTGAAVLIVGLFGGWVISRQIFCPLAAISATASRISGTNLTERIDPDPLDTELTELATVLNEAFDRLQAAFDRQARFTADASHELRTLLAVIRTQAELALLRPRTADEYRIAVETCLRAAERMTDLVERLLMLARVDAGAALKREPVNLDKVVADVVAQHAPLAAEKGVTVRPTLAPAIDFDSVTGQGTTFRVRLPRLYANPVR